MSDDLTPDVEGAAAAGGMDRRTFVRRAAVTGALAWAAPSITSMPAAFAQTNGGSEICRPTIDPFTKQQKLETDGITGPQTVSDGSILGNDRTASITKISGPNDATLSIAPTGAPGKFFLSVDGSTVAEALLTWDGFSNLDLKGDGADRFLFSVDPTDSRDVLVTVTVVEGATSKSASETVATPTDITLLFTDPRFAGITFTSVDSISLTVKSEQTGADAVTLAFKVCYIN